MVEAVEAVEATRTVPDEQLVTDLLAERDRKIWKERDLAKERQFGQSYMRLMSYIEEPGAVVTPQGQGTLIDVKSYGCRVLLLRGGKQRIGKKQVSRTKSFAVEDVKPYRGEHR